MSDFGESLFNRAKRVSPAEIAREHGAKLRRSGQKKARGECLLCGHSDTFLADDPGPIWHCFACGESGDSIKFEMLFSGHADRTEAAKVLAGEAERVERERPVRASTEPEQSDLVDSATVADWIVCRMKPATGTIVEAWLSSRGIDISKVTDAIGRLHFLDRCPTSPWRVGSSPEGMRSRPAMVAALRETSDGPIVGVHTTFLRSDGRGKANLGIKPDGKPRNIRKMWGRARHAACFLADVAGAGPLCPGEGVETVLSYAADLGGPCRPLALLSLNNLQGRALRDEQGVVPLWNVRVDPEGLPFTLPRPGEVHVLVDADMSPVRMRVQAVRRGRREWMMVDRVQRAEICAALATQAWRRAGASPVRAVRPPMGMDFNDLGMEAA